MGRVLFHSVTSLHNFSEFVKGFANIFRLQKIDKAVLK